MGRRAVGGREAPGRTGLTTRSCPQLSGASRWSPMLPCSTSRAIRWSSSPGCSPLIGVGSALRRARALDPLRQAVLVLRWFRERGCGHCLARDAGVSQPRQPLPARGHRRPCSSSPRPAPGAEGTPGVVVTSERRAARGWPHMPGSGARTSPRPSIWRVVATARSRRTPCACRSTRPLAACCIPGNWSVPVTESRAAAPSTAT
jgi:hypothetical protein